jgi:hypothetical protein
LQRRIEEGALNMARRRKALAAADILTAGPGDRAPEELDMPHATGKQELVFLGSIAAVFAVLFFLGKKAEATPRSP